MTQTLKLGPLVLSMELAVLIAAIIVALVVDAWMGRRHARKEDTTLWTIFLVAVLVARIAFVMSYLDQYLQSPLKIIDLRDGGFNAMAGVIAGLAMTGWFLVRDASRRVALAASILLGGLVWTGGTLSITSAKENGNALPEVSLIALDGTTVGLKAFAGKPMVINLWATWCPPCRREMPALRDAQAAHKDVTFVFINQGETPESVMEFLQSQGLVLSNVLMDRTMQAGRQWKTGALPSTLFLDANGKVVDSRIGELSAATLAQRIAALRSVHDANAR